MDVVVEGQGACTLVAVHGIQGTRSAWEPVARELAAHARIVLPNLRGRGRADRGQAASDYTLSCYAGDLEQVISTHAGSEPLVLAGWSLGVSIILQYLSLPGARRPDALVLASGSPCIAQTAWFEGDGPLLRRSVGQRRHRLGLSEFADDDSVAWTWEAIRGSDQRALLATIDTPALVLHGRDDRDCPPDHAQCLADGLGAQLVILDGVGHNVPTQAAAKVACHLRQVLRNISCN